MNQRESPAEQLPELVRDWGDIVAQVATECGVSPEVARSLGEAAALRIAGEYGGRHFYLAQCMMVRLDRRDRAILDEFTGNNYEALAAKHGRSERHIRRLVKRATFVDLLQRQGDMFPEGRTAPSRR